MKHVLVARVDAPALRAQLHSAVAGWATRIVPDFAPALVAQSADAGPWFVATFDTEPAGEPCSPLVIGWQAGPPSEYGRVGGGSVTGSAAIARWDEGGLEVATDSFASRSWFVGERDGLAVAATSMRLATLALGEFEINERAARWFLATGVLPPGQSHNARLRVLAPATVARCEPTGPAAWATRTDVVDFRASRETPAELERQLRHAITEAVGSLADAEGWMSPLSGGVDSRALLLFWRGALPPTVTWGTESALRDDTSDAVVAARVAERLGTSNRYVVVEPTDIETDEVLRRFRDVCEGRIDHFGGYADGFAVFDSLHASGVRAIVRGDEAFGWSRSLSEEDLYRSLALSFGVRVRGLPPALEALVADQQLPPATRRRPGESLAGWRDRLYAGVRAPTVLAALNACKAPWVDIANPFLHREVVEVVRRLPDRLRTDKALFKRIVGSMGIDVPYARTAAIATPRDVLSSPASRALLSDELRALAPSWLGDEATDWLAERASRAKAEPKGRRAWMESVRRYVPPSWKAPARLIAGTPPVPARQWALRAWLAASTHAVLREDAEAGAPHQA